MTRYAICAVIGGLLLGSCHIYSRYERPQLDVEGLYRDPVQADRTLAPDSASLADLSWKEVFTDPQLQVLIGTALERNADLQSAMLKVQAAEAALMSARLSYLPAFMMAPEGGVSSFDRQKGSWTWTAPVTASWELDIFGKLLNKKRAAKAALMRSEAYRQAVQTQVVAAVANNYYHLLMLDRQLEISRKTTELWAENLETMKALKEGAVVNEAGVVQSEANYRAVAASLHDLENQIRKVENALCLLLRQAPRRIERGRLEDQRMPERLHAGVPVQLLSRRPDVKMAEMALAATYYKAAEARSAFYPSLSIKGNVGWTNHAGAVVNPGKLIASALGSLTQPLFYRGSNIARLKMAKAEQKEAMLGFEQAMLNAGADVSDALDLYESAGQKTVQHGLQVAALEKSVKYSRYLLTMGTATYLEVLAARHLLLSAQLSQVEDSFQQMQAVVNLYHALGGGVE